ncbi:MAG: type II toxin-antitoxin system RelE/ParE family toxin [Pseudomonadota bacterium]
MMNEAPSHTVVETAAFTARVKKLGLSKEELGAIYDIYATTPDHGKIVRNTGGLRKGRAAKDDSGKSGGYRVFSFFTDRSNPVFLLWLIDKTDDDTLTAQQEKTFKALATQLKKELRDEGH